MTKLKVMLNILIFLKNFLNKDINKMMMVELACGTAPLAFYFVKNLIKKLFVAIILKLY